MTCREAGDLLDPYVDGELEGDLEIRARAHFESCGECESQRRNRLRLQAILAGTLGGDGREEASLWPQIADAIEAGGIAQAAGRTTRRGVPGRRGPARYTSTGRRRVGIAAGLGVAAAGLLAFAFLLGDQGSRPVVGAGGLAGGEASGGRPDAEDASRLAQLPEPSPPSMAPEDSAPLLASEWQPQILPGEVEFSGPMMSLWREAARE